jgi:hypothetical protein
MSSRYMQMTLVWGSSEADELGKAEVVDVGVVEDGRADRARLGDEAEVALAGNLEGEAGVHGHRGIGVDDAQAVGTHEGYIVLGDFLLDLLLELDARAADFLETCGDDEQGLDAQLAGLVDHVGDHVRRDHEDGHVNGLADGGEVGMGPDRVDVPGLGIHGKDRSLETSVEQVQEDGVAHRPGPGGRADDGDGSGIEERIDVAIHGSCLSVDLSRRYPRRALTRIDLSRS